MGPGARITRAARRFSPKGKKWPGTGEVSGHPVAQEGKRLRTNSTFFLITIRAARGGRGTVMAWYSLGWEELADNV